MQAILGILTFRTFLIFISTAFAILVVMLAVEIITTHEVAQILNLSPSAENALNQVISRFQEVSKNAINIASQLLNNIFHSKEINVDLSKIKINFDSFQHQSTSESIVSQ